MNKTRVAAAAWLLLCAPCAAPALPVPGERCGALAERPGPLRARSGEAREDLPMPLWDTEPPRRRVCRQAREFTTRASGEAAFRASLRPAPPLPGEYCACLRREP